MIQQLVNENDEILGSRGEIFNLKLPPVSPKDFEEELVENMLHYNGVGLSANQIGKPYKVFTMLHEGEPLTMFNPRIIQVSDNQVLETEGCLSYPGLFIKVKRPSTVVVSYYDKDRNNFQGYFSELSARIIQHEMDHMLGNVFYETASKLHISQGKKKRKINLRKMKKDNHVLIRKP